LPIKLKQSSNALNCAKHAGIICAVSVFSVPQSHLSDLVVIASFDRKQAEAIPLKTTLSSQQTSGTVLHFTAENDEKMRF
jgi:hypothetical protein